MSFISDFFNNHGKDERIDSLNKMSPEEAQKHVGESFKELEKFIVRCPVFEQNLFKDIKDTTLHAITNKDTLPSQEVGLMAVVLEAKLKYLMFCLDRCYGKE